MEKIVEEAVLEKSKLHSSQSTKKEEEEEKKSLIDKKNEKSKTKKNTNPMRLGEPGELESSILQMRINKSIIQSTKKASYSYCILWRALLLDQPEIQATEHLLDEAYKRIRRAEGVWERAQSFRFTGFEAQKFYAMYLIQVLLRKDEGIEILRDFYKKRWKEFQRKAKIQNFEADTKMEEFSDPVFYIKTNEVRPIKYYSSGNRFSFYQQTQRYFFIQINFKIFRHFHYFSPFPPIFDHFA